MIQKKTIGVWGGPLVAAFLAGPTAAETTAKVEPFEVSIPEDVITDLKTRLKMTRMPKPIRGSGYAYGIETG